MIIRDNYACRTFSSFSAYSGDVRRTHTWSQSPSANEDNRLFALTMWPRTQVEQDLVTRLVRRVRDRADDGFVANTPPSWREPVKPLAPFDTVPE